MTRQLDSRIRDDFNAFVADARYPCLAAKGLVNRDEYHLAVYSTLGSTTATRELAKGLASFAHGLDPADVDDPLTAFVAVFTGRAPGSEPEFERRLWLQLQRLHERDDPASRWDPAVSDDPADPRFSFSFAGCGLFVIGLHPASSREARRFAWPALVFNPHAQFERLREHGLYARLRDHIRERDLALQGTINPNLADFGERSEARQYSGRDTTDAAWQCPFHPRKP
jgi:FPC/CPF motif-containing protein YcgG